MLTSINGEPQTTLHESMHSVNHDERFNIYEIEAIIRKIDFFSNYSDDQISEIALISREVHAEHGELLCRQGETGNSIFVIAKGNLGVFKRTNNQDKLVYTAGPGEILGEIAVLGNIPRSASLRALNSVNYLEIDGAHFIKMLHDNPDMSLKIIRMLIFRFAA